MSVCLLNKWMNEWMNVFKWRYSLNCCRDTVTLNKSYRLKVSVVSENGSNHVRSSNDALNRTVLHEVVPKRVERRHSPDARWQRVPGTRRCHWKGSVADRGPAGWRHSKCRRAGRSKTATIIPRKGDSLHSWSPAVHNIWAAVRTSYACVHIVTSEFLKTLKNHTKIHNARCPYLHCTLSLAAQCIVIGAVCGYVFVCVCVLWVCDHDNSNLRASIFTKLGL